MALPNKYRGINYRPAGPGVRACETCRVPAMVDERFCFMCRHTYIVKMVKAGYLEAIHPENDPIPGDYAPSLGHRMGIGLDGATRPSMARRN